MIDVHAPSKKKERISVGRFLDFKRSKFFRYISTILLEKKYKLDNMFVIYFKQDIAFDWL
jgi:hypothetical protein